VQAIVALGRALDMTLLAEGVETEEQRVLLRLAGCEEMQGYLFARRRPARRSTGCWPKPLPPALPWPDICLRSIMRASVQERA
jgi:EAL domain-containing protein (putative c-di-GMP-specific phosphodiesterase class I)